jgi:hypothetical protein
MAGRIAASSSLSPELGNRQHHVARRHHAEVAVARFARVHEHRRRAGRGQRGGDLAADVAALAHAHHDDAAVAFEHRLHRLREGRALACFQAEQRLRLDVEGVARELQRALGIERGSEGRLGAHGDFRRSDSSRGGVI